MLKVVELDTKSGLKREVVDRLRELLEMAEDGLIVDFSYAGCHNDGSVFSGFTKTEDAPRRLASVSRLQHRLHRMMDEQSELD